MLHHENVIPEVQRSESELARVMSVERRRRGGG